eukprot:5560-Heterococcus_DN1.PRE.3
MNCSAKNVTETLLFLREKHSAAQPDVARIKEFLRRANNGIVTGCDACGVLLQLQLVTPCAHILCPACVKASMHACRVCEAAIDTDEFQLLQPGCDLAWHFEKLQLEDPDWAVTIEEHSKVRKVLQDVYSLVPTAVRAQLTTNISGSSSSDSSADSGGGSCSGSSSSALNSSARVKLEEGQSNARPLKVIIYSQFRGVLDAVGDKMYRYFGNCPTAGWLKRGEECVAEYFGTNKNAELFKFKNNPDCVVMLLSKQGAEGLDLSFVTHIYLLEEIWNKSEEQQVISRAHRMGATGQVKVIQLLMKDTVETTMRDWVATNNSSGTSATSTSSAKQKDLLQNNSHADDADCDDYEHDDDSSQQQQQQQQQSVVAKHTKKNRKASGSTKSSDFNRTVHFLKSLKLTVNLNGIEQRPLLIREHTAVTATTDSSTTTSNRVLNGGASVQLQQRQLHANSLRMLATKQCKSILKNTNRTTTINTNAYTSHRKGASSKSKSQHSTTATVKKKCVSFEEPTAEALNAVRDNDDDDDEQDNNAMDVIPPVAAAAAALSPQQHQSPNRHTVHASSSSSGGSSGSSPNGQSESLKRKRDLFDKQALFERRSEKITILEFNSNVNNGGSSSSGDVQHGGSSSSSSSSGGSSSSRSSSSRS